MSEPADDFDSWEDKEMSETRCIDNAICPKCKKMFSGGEAVNYEIRSKRIKCPHCGVAIDIYTSVEYQCSLAEGEDCDE